MPNSSLSEETGVPLRWVFGLLIGCATFTSIAVGTGMYFGTRDARADGLVERVTKLEQAIDAISVVDRRLARIEGALGIGMQNQRMPAGDSK